MIEIRSPHLTGAEISWFAPICSDDYEFLGVPDGRLRSNFAHTANILQTADKLGYRNILCPSSYQVGQDTLTFAAAVAPMTEKINLLTAVRCGATA
ncbi:MAG: LLM class flavin-dependent oxidoreductase [Anaerolineales bacterium]|nr:LLM class flavin-dependent oxidoreductase [Anaerolineales bacterium]